MLHGDWCLHQEASFKQFFLACFCDLGHISALLFLHDLALDRGLHLLELLQFHQALLSALIFSCCALSVLSLEDEGSPLPPEGLRVGEVGESVEPERWRSTGSGLDVLSLDDVVSATKGRYVCGIGPSSFRGWGSPVWSSEVLAWVIISYFSAAGGFLLIPGVVGLKAAGSIALDAGSSFLLLSATSMALSRSGFRSVP